MTAETNIDDWVETGVANGWCGPIICSTCDGVPATETEIDDAHCVYVLRLYQTEQERLAVEAEHSPSTWRNKWTSK